MKAQGKKRISKKKASEDIDFVLKTIQSDYAYFDQKKVNWEKVRLEYSGKVQHVRRKREFLRLLENLIFELYDDHVNLNVNLPDSYRLVPSNLFIWAEWVNGRAIVREVKRPFPISNAEIYEGMEITLIDGMEVEVAINNILGDSLLHNDLEAKNWGLRKLLAGKYNQSLQIQLRDNDHSFELILDYDKITRTNPPLAFGKILEDSIGYIRINNSLGSYELIGVFDSLLNSFIKTKGLIIDLRDTPSGGNTTVGKAILGRFIESEQIYQKYMYPNGMSQHEIKTGSFDIVFPRNKKSYSGPVAVLTGHWTGSMGEGMAIGFDGTKSGTTVGTSMARLLGSIENYTLPNTGIRFSLPTQKTYHVNGNPREQFSPKIKVELTKQNNTSIEDPVLNAGLIFLDQ